MNREMTVYVGGSGGSDPYSPKTWSGISQRLLPAMKDAGLLRKAVSVKLSGIENALLQARNFSSDRSVWRQKFYLDPSYRNAMTRVASSISTESLLCLQYGTMFSLPEAFPAKKSLSYQDGNLAQALEGGFNMRGVPRKRIEEALRFEEEVSQRLAAVLTFSEYLRQSFIHDYRVPSDKVFNIGGGINLLETPALVVSKNYTTNKILFIGIEFERKGGPQLLKAFRTVRERIPNAELHIVGPGNLEDLPSGVVFHGRLSKTIPAQKAALELLFRTSNLFVLPSLYEPFGIAPLEAMFYQIPCLLTDAWAFKEFVTPGVNGDLVEKGSVEDLASKMHALLSNPDQLALMGCEARRLVEGRYTWSSVAQRMSKVVEKLVAGS